jgi:hypothetical protein
MESRTGRPRFKESQWAIAASCMDSRIEDGFQWPPISQSWVRMIKDSE